MGSISYTVNKTDKTIDLLRQEINGEYKIIDHSTKGGVTYLAVQHKDDDRVEAAVALHSRRSTGYFGEQEFTLKIMDEGMGPYNYDCPRRILNKLSDPPMNDYAREWRAKCAERLDKVAEGNKVKPGATIRFASPITFNDGVERDTFTFEGRNVFTSTDYTRCKISNWKKRAFEVLVGVPA
jgi:hypothetical protein